MTKPHATNPGVVRERRQKAAIERRAEKRERKGTMAIERSTGIVVEGWYGPRPGGGYRGITAELDETVAHAADLLAAAYGEDVQIRFNSDRRSGGAFLPDGIGIGAGYRKVIPEGETVSSYWLTDRRTEWDALPERISITVYAPAAAIHDPEMADQGPVSHRYAYPELPTVKDALEWIFQNRCEEGAL